MEAHTPTLSRGRLIRRATGLAALLFAAVSLLPTGAPATDQEPESLEATREALQEWVQTRKLISAEKADWDLRKRLLTDEVGMLEGSIEGLRGRIAEMEKSISEARGTETELSTENEELKASGAALRERVTQLEARVSALLKRMPEQVQTLVRPLSQSMPTDPATTELSLSVRYRNINGILNLINKFNREIHLKSESRELPDGSSAEVQVLYLGVGQAFYVTQDARAAGIGTVGADGWVWLPANEHAEAIAQAIAIYNNEQPAAFLRLPVQIQ